MVMVMGGGGGSAEAAGTIELLSYTNGAGLQIDCKFAREASMYSAAMNFLQLTLSNRKAQVINRIRVVTTQTTQQVVPFPEVPMLPAGQSLSVQLHIDFAGSTNAAQFAVQTDGGMFPVVVTPPIGELMRPFVISEPDFGTMRARLSGMQENSAKFIASGGATSVPDAVLRSCNVAMVVGSGADIATSGRALFAGETLRGGQKLLVSVQVDPMSGQGVVTVNCEDPMFGSALVAFIAKASGS